MQIVYAWKLHLFSTQLILTQTQQDPVCPNTKIIPKKAQKETKSLIRDVSSPFKYLLILYNIGLQMFQ